MRKRVCRQNIVIIEQPRLYEKLVQSEGIAERLRERRIYFCRTNIVHERGAIRGLLAVFMVYQKAVARASIVMGHYRQLVVTNVSACY